MKIVLMSIGTLGDIEPFLAIGEILQEKGHQVICAFPDQFKNLAEESELDFVSLGTKYIELLESKAGKTAFGGSGSFIKKFHAYLRLARKYTEINKELINRQYELIEGKIYAIIHHEGSVTTHLALKYGCATMIIPHIIEQFAWNKIIAEKGGGPRGIRIDKITTKNLEPEIPELVNNASFRRKAEKIASQICLQQVLCNLKAS